MKKETLEEIAEIFAIESVIEYMKIFPDCDNTFDYRRGFVDGFIKYSKFQQEQNKNKFNEEEVLELLQDFANDLSDNVINIKFWFNKFKKK